VIEVCTLLWATNERSALFSRGYNEKWVNRLYLNFRRHLTRPFHFTVFTDRDRTFLPGVQQERLTRLPPDYGNCVEPFRLDVPMILVGLDTVIIKNIDHLADWALNAGDKIGMPKHPYRPWACNGVVLAPGGRREIFDRWRGENDMEWLRRFPHVLLDDIFPKQIVSYKAHVLPVGELGAARIVYFHGRPKQPELKRLPWVRENWLEVTP